MVTVDDDGLCGHGYEHGERGTVHARQGWRPIAAPLTDEQLDRLKAEWERKRHGHPKILGLPRRVRLRLAATRALDHVAMWLIDHGHYGAAGRLWRTFGMWR